MAIITISRGSLSGGANLAKMLSEELNYQCISREMLLEWASSEYNLDRQTLVESLEKTPSLFQRIIGGSKNYLKILRAVLMDHAKSNDIVYHGHAGHFLLDGIKCILKVRLIAPMPQRIRAAMELKQMSKEEAEQHIQKVDESRIRWTKYLYNIDWRDPEIFDLVINLETMKMNTAKDIICTAISKSEFQVCKSGSEMLQNMALSAKVEAYLSNSPKTETLELKIDANDGIVRLNGPIESEQVRSDVTEIVKAVPGVKSILDEMVVKSISPIPT